MATFRPLAITMSASHSKKNSRPHHWDRLGFLVARVGLGASRRLAAFAAFADATRRAASA